MVPLLVYRSGSVPSLHLAIDPAREFREVVDEVGSIGFPPLAVNAELASFALLELLSNSVRAHRERGVKDHVSLRLQAETHGLEVTVLDAGRGFDPRNLPYDLDGRIDSVDLMSPGFNAYRELHGGSRFGMGLYVARKTFPRFSLRFVDREGRECPWYAGSVRGTRIDLGVPYASARAVHHSEELGILEPVGEESGGGGRERAWSGRAAL